MFCVMRFLRGRAICSNVDSPGAQVTLASCSWNTFSTFPSGVSAFLMPSRWHHGFQAGPGPSVEEKRRQREEIEDRERQLRKELREAFERKKAERAAAEAAMSPDERAAADAAKRERIERLERAVAEKVAEKAAREQAAKDKAVRLRHGHGALDGLAVLRSEGRFITVCTTSEASRHSNSTFHCPSNSTFQCPSGCNACAGDAGVASCTT